jgi:hypothetical protein
MRFVAVWICSNPASSRIPAATRLNHLEPLSHLPGKMGLQQAAARVGADVAHGARVAPPPRHVAYRPRRLVQVTPRRLPAPRPEPRCPEPPGWCDVPAPRPEPRCPLTRRLRPPWPRGVLVAPGSPAACAQWRVRLPRWVHWRARLPHTRRSILRRRDGGCLKTGAGTANEKFTRTPRRT